MMGPNITYKSTAADDRYLTELVVESSGVGRLTVGSNRDRRAAAVGRFEGPLTAALVQKLTAATGAAAFATAPSQASLVPDESYREIRVITPGGAPVTKRVGEQAPAPPSVAQVERTLQEIIAHLQQYPIAALAMRVSAPPTVVAGISLELDLVIANPGRALLRFPAPKLWGQAGVSAELMVLRADVPVASLRMSDQRFVQLGPTNFVASDPPIPAGEIPLASGERIRLRFRPAADWPPGKYALELSLGVTATGADGKPALSGGLVSAPQALEVVRP